MCANHAVKVLLTSANYMELRPLQDGPPQFEYDCQLAYRAGLLSLNELDLLRKSTTIESGRAMLKNLLEGRV